MAIFEGAGLHILNWDRAHKMIQQKIKFRTPYFCYPTENFNLIETVEDTMPGQRNFQTIIFKFQDRFSALLQRKI